MSGLRLCLLVASGGWRNSETQDECGESGSFWVWQEKVGSTWQMSQMGTTLLANPSGELGFKCSSCALLGSRP